MSFFFFQQDFGAGKKSVSPRVRANVQNQFPIFVFYPKDRKGIQYSGPISEHHILEFILNCQEPVSVVQNMENFHELRANSGGQTLVGYFPGLQSSKPTLNYLRFLKVTATSCRYCEDN